MRIVRLLPLLPLLLVATAIGQSRTHLVRPGESLDDLVSRYGVTATEIRAANQLPTTNLPPGQLLRIPAASSPTVRAATAIPVARPVPAAEPTAEPTARTAQPASASRDVVPLPESTPAPSLRPSYAAAIRQASGTRYNGRWTPPGESTAWVMDCSNTARWLQREVRGVDLPRTASDQYEYLRQRRQLWRTGTDPRKLRRKLRVGDLLFWENTYKPVRKPAITHVMTYLGTDGAGQMKMAGSQGSKGVNVYTFSPDRSMGGYRFFLFFRREGKFVAYGRP
jgi:cell wall-associated NlpC family hydrolase